MIIPPIAFMLSFSNLGSPFPFDNRNETSDEKSWDTKPSPSFRFLPLVPIIIVLVWLGIGIRQWFVLSKWDKKYKNIKNFKNRLTRNKMMKTKRIDNATFSSMPSNFG
jgi:hypothetical protein